MFWHKATTKSYIQLSNVDNIYFYVFYFRFYRKWYNHILDSKSINARVKTPLVLKWPEPHLPLYQKISQLHTTYTIVTDITENVHISCHREHQCFCRCINSVSMNIKYSSLNVNFMQRFYVFCPMSAHMGPAAFQA